MLLGTVGAVGAAVLGGTSVRIVDKASQTALKIIDTRTGQALDILGQFTSDGMQLIDARTNDALRMVYDTSTNFLQIIDSRTQTIVGSITVSLATALEIVDQRSGQALAIIEATGEKLIATTAMVVTGIWVAALFLIFGVLLLFLYRIVAADHSKLFKQISAGVVFVALVLAYWRSANDVGSIYYPSRSIPTPTPTPSVLALHPPGTILAYAGSVPPAGWALCDGSQHGVSEPQWAALATAIGTAFGGRDTTFNLPDLRGRVIVGSGAATSGSTYVLGRADGAEKHTLTIAEMPRHQHGTDWGDRDLELPLSHYGSRGPTNRGGSGKTDYDNPEFLSEAIGGGEAHPNMQPYLVVHYIIKK